MSDEECDGIIEAITIWLGDAESVERSLPGGGYIDDPDTFLAVVTDHSERVKTLTKVRERLQSASGG